MMWSTVVIFFNDDEKRIHPNLFLQKQPLKVFAAQIMTSCQENDSLTGRRVFQKCLFQKCHSICCVKWNNYIHIHIFMMWKFLFSSKRTHPDGKIAEKAAGRSAFWTIWHCILNADSTKTNSSSVTFWHFCPLGILLHFLSSWNSGSICGILTSLILQW